MEQLTQSLRDGKMQIQEVPFPALNPGTVLIRNHFSVISAGTEGKTVKDARLGYIGKARARKAEVKKVIQTAKTLGWMNTYKMVMNRLDAPAPLGYSCAGEIIAIAGDVTAFQVGDRVACGGNTANHSEIVAVPVQLCSKVPDQVNLESAAFTTLGAIALQGIRQADLRLGENCVVIGLGLIGQLTVQLLAASGIRSIGIDIDNYQVQEALKNGATAAYTRSNDHLEAAVLSLTGGYGADAVIITAGSSSNDPVDLAGTLCRQKGKVIIVGAVPTGFERAAYFKKELDLRMSCSYGPGRYDTDYEEHGIDYPYAYVRWTENRNMEAFLRLIADNKIDPAKVITHRFDFNKAPEAYNLIVNRSEPLLGITLKFDLSKTPQHTVYTNTKETAAPGAAAPAVSFIGAGSFAQSFLLPAVSGAATLRGIATARAANARNMQDKYGFAFSSGDTADILNDAETNTVFIATRHNTHAGYVMESLRKHKNVFVEKPLCMSESELIEIASLYKSSGTRLMVGFNRRFAPFTEKVMQLLPADSSLPVSINYRINAGILPAAHWIHDPEVGGGRLLGEACHFIDLCAYISRSPVQSVSAQTMTDPGNNRDTFVIALTMANGSIASVSYFSNGNKSTSKEFLEVFSDGLVVTINDFAEMTVTGSQRENGSRKSGQNKGHKEGVRKFLESIQNGTASPVSFESQFNSMLATFKALESIAMKGERLTL
ncbi:MAG TPA: bi-domain-containing oxidoreductase [Bacteroidia bacterium]|nr:bi-domain-containing oxidoreductase [Bacteroidia bacterium]